jgi:Tfp pilus assembly protein PilX
MKMTGRNRQRGSLLVVTMLFATLLVVALSTYVALNTHSLKMANRSFYATEAMNMAESGLEEAVWSFNQANLGSTTAWDGWTIVGDAATRTFSNFVLGAGATGSVKVYVDHYNPAPTVQPIVVAKSTVTLPNNGGSVSKYVEIKMKRRTYFAAGLVAKNNIYFSGNTASVDSWISDPDNDDATPAIGYSAGIKRDKGSVGGASVTSTLVLGNADIFGTAAVGGSSTAAITVGSNGRVGPFSTANGVKDPASVATDFSTNLETISNPVTGTTIASLGATIGTTGTATIWRTPTISNSLTVYGDVTMILTAGAGVDAIDITGSEGITLAAGATLTIYTEGDVKLAGNGLLNNNDDPSTFQIWGTSTSSFSQDIQIAGNGALKGIVYAPNGHVKINGNGDVMGAVVGKEITVVGNAAFHYDESLADWGKNTPFGIYKWRELIAAGDRDDYTTQLAF